MDARTAQAETKGLFGALFDLSFSHFVTLKFAKVIYLLFMVVIAIGAIVFLFGTVSNDAMGGGAKVLSILILLPIGTFLSLVYARVIIETLIVMFRVAENTRRAADVLEGGSGAAVATSPAPGSDAGTPFS